MAVNGTWALTLKCQPTEVCYLSYNAEGSYFVACFLHGNDRTIPDVNSKSILYYPSGAVNFTKYTCSENCTYLGHCLCKRFL